MRKLFLLLFMLAVPLCMLSCGGTQTVGTDTGAASDTTPSPESHPDTQKDKEAVSDKQTEPEQKEEYIPPRKIKIACVGDSLTYGVGASSPGASSYPAQLQMALGGEHYEVRNFGRSSSYMIDPADYPDFKYASTRSVAYKSTDEYKNSLKYDADIVIICLGANDAYISNTNSGVDQQRYFRESAIAMARTYMALPSSPEVVFMYPPSRYDAQYRYDYLKNTIIPLIDEAAKEVGADVIDLFSLTDPYAKQKNTIYITTDGIHYTARGYTEIARTVYGWVSDFRLD